MKKKILTVFGSTSDRGVYEPLIEELNRDFPTEGRVISAHRNPRQLRELVEKDIYDVYVAGAGLAAHLPGVVASMTPRPVIGLPVPAAFSGFDSLLSILQMPTGVPVLTFGPSGRRGIGAFLKGIRDLEKTSEISVIGEKASNKELDRLEARAQEMHYTIRLEGRPSPGRATINMVSKPEDILEGSVINVPVLEKGKIAGPEGAQEVFHWIESGSGAWVGVNNTRNALLWWDKFFSL